jgi:hypothetical protein
LKNKLSQKSSGSQSEETVLLKAFKYFDLNNNGTVEPEEFAKAVEKIGIMIPTRQVSAPDDFLEPSSQDYYFRNVYCARVDKDTCSDTI